MKHTITAGLCLLTAGPVLAGHGIDAILEMAGQSPTTGQQIIAADHEAGLGEIGVNRSGALPRLDLSLNASRVSSANLSGQPGSGTGRADGSSYDWSLQLSQPLFAFGRIMTVWKMAGAGRQLLDLQHRQQQNRYRDRIIAAYGDALLSRDRQQTSEMSVSQLKAVLEFTRLEYNGGARDKVDLLQARSAWEKAVADAALHRAEAEVLLNRLKVILGRENDADFSLATRPEPEAAFLRIREPTGQSGTSLDQKVLAARAALTELRADYEGAGHWPTLSLFGSATGRAWSFPPLVDDAATDAFAADRRDYAVGLRLDWTLFAGLGISAAHRKARATARRDRLELEEKQKLAAGDRLAARRRFEAGGLIFRAAKSAGHAAQLALAKAEADYKGGTLPMTLLIKAEKDWRESRWRLTEAWIHWLQAASGLRQILGQQDEGSRHP